MSHRSSWLSFSLVACASAPSLPPGVEAFDWQGRPLTAPPLPEAARAKHEADLAAAEAVLAANPNDVTAIVWVGRRLGYLGRFREAIATYTRGLALHPDHPELLRHRGHRWITVHEFARAERDLAAAAVACRSIADAVEPDGQPEPGRPPHSTLHHNVHYHLGLARFLLGDFAGAERAWLDCLAVVGNDESRVAVTHWLWCARMRQGDRAGAAAVVAPIRADLDVVENRSYHALCRLYRGDLRAEDLQPAAGSAGAAMAFGLAHYWLVVGDPTRALAALRELAALPGWAAFGVIAAGAELNRQR
jgi:tetratricopeptide (TPR) repeat protein